MKKEINKIKINPDLDQHFMVNKSTIKKIVKNSEINQTDIILEIGAGLGALTKEISKKSEKVYAMEIDPQFKKYLIEIGGNVEVIIENARTFWKRNKTFNKIIANIPYNLCEPLMHFLHFAKQVKQSFIITSKNFYNSAKKNPVFNSFLNFEKIMEIPKEDFFPVPKVDSYLIKITHKPNYEEDKDAGSFIARKMYMRENSKLKNGFLISLIELHKLKHNTQLTKKEAKKIISKMDFLKPEIDKEIKDISLDSYRKIKEYVEILK